ncbi:hypothetical protein, variant 1 [Phytophthora nicotianae P10297]|uniref:Uncharacterized protein n=4 Tax=Phytophthora nicotianae TaxID=4792 RepID=W2ZPU5_PHYNI|nr:hypothetical protein PPTG_09478 [Phytophthora nicotianae INRA-310]XP_008902725.1 hypothetical protein, variant 1 [Phytophthora nicotianae INRA-310]ETP49044.1 hypothetical protein F442_05339 [Phytophthora nicotianae P10297]ETN11783.1 hypothetical protein PPTG_09478 [Phytophthora nicotianae INRA-310]ETN11784.1 hypothetical protein, variant 1 [Phytophthora nicotianae INRA-310]ETP49045.1 hypothetical protein, variant 1 [Phytophthora nicotianae P10297]
MASTQTTDEPKKPSPTRARKTTPRSRSKKEKKAPTPRRRASPRNRKAADSELEKNQKEKDQEKAAVEPPPPPVKAEQEHQQKQETTEDNTEDEKQPPSETKDEAELPLSQDTPLRRNYLQRMYRQLQTTHPHQDDAMIRHIATNVEMDMCQKATTRSQYVATMEQEIHKLMQFEMEQANTTGCSDDTQGFGNVLSNTQAQSGEMQGGYSQHQMSQSRSYEYAQALAKAQEKEQANNFGRSPSFSTPRQSMNGGDTSFQSLMGNQTPGYMTSGMQQQQQSTPNRAKSMQKLQQMGNQFYSTSSMAPPTTQSFSVPSNVNETASQATPRNMMETHQQRGNFHVQQHAQQPRIQSRVTSFSEFSAQIQHLDKSVLIELLWNQRGALARWQNQAKQLELQLRNASSNLSSTGYNSPYNASTGSFVSPNAAAEAEMQRARARSNSRTAQQKMPTYYYGQQPNFTNGGYAQANGNMEENPQQYWERIRALKAAYEDKLLTAQRALAHNTAPPNSVYSAKAKSMMQNIGLVLTILNEQPTNAQPRKFEVLNSIERFMQMSVLPIVQKVLSSSHLATGSRAPVASGSSASVTTSVASYSPGQPPNSVRMTAVPQPTSIFTDGQQFTDVESKNTAGHVHSPTMNTPTHMMEGLAAGNSPNNAVSREDHKNCQNRVYEAPTITPKGLSSSSLPSVESRPSAITETRLPSLSPGGNTRDSKSSKMMESNIDDTLNEFSELAGMDFDDPVVESSILVKENNPSNVMRKRGIEDV